MGFWSSLVHTASSIGGWAINNAGSILKVATTVASVLAVASLEDEAEEIYADGDTNVVRTLYSRLTKAEREMMAYALVKVPQPIISTGGTVSGPYYLPCLWPHPPSDGTVPPAVAADIHKFLSINGLPSTLSASGTSLDVGAQIAQGMFANSISREEVWSEGATAPYQFSPFNIGPFGGVTIVGGHIYYPLPMGNVDSDGTAGPGANVSWHSCLILWMTSTDQARQHLRQQRAKLAVLPFSAPAPSGPYNASTIRATWTGAATNVDQIMSNAVKQVLGNVKRGITLSEPPSFTGTTYSYQFSSPVMTGPGLVNSLLTDAINNQISQLNDSTTTPAMPEVKVVKMSCLLSNPNNAGQ